MGIKFNNAHYQLLNGYFSYVRPFTVVPTPTPTPTLTPTPTPTPTATPSGTLNLIGYVAETPYYIFDCSTTGTTPTTPVYMANYTLGQLPRIDSATTLIYLDSAGLTLLPARAGLVYSFAKVSGSVPQKHFRPSTTYAGSISEVVLCGTLVPYGYFVSSTVQTNVGSTNRLYSTADESFMYAGAPAFSDASYTWVGSGTYAWSLTPNSASTHLITVNGNTITSVTATTVTTIYNVDNLTVNGTWSKPTNITSVTVELIGSGGGGGGAATNTAGGGGAGGQYAKKTITYGTGVSGITYTIGGGGATGTGDGTAGVDSTWDTSVVVAKGGAPGIANNGQGGLGSTTGGIGDIVYAGGSGASGSFASTFAGGGGGAAGELGAGGSATTNVGGLGNGQFSGDGATGPTSYFVGNLGNLYGGGGSGGFKANAGSARSGGAGAVGFGRVTYPYEIISSVFLTQYTGSFVAYSLRKLSSNASATASIQVRRSSDSSLQNIGFQSNGDLDSGSLLTFVGTGNDGFVTTWYDQSGNGLHATQTTASFQPKIVINGSLKTTNGKPSIYFSSSFLFTQNPTSSINFSDSTGRWTAVGVGQSDESTTSRLMWNFGNTFAQALRVNTTGLESIAFNQAAGAFTDAGSDVGTSQFIAVAERKSTSIEIWGNNSSAGATTTTGTNATSSTLIVGIIGNFTPVSPSFAWSGSMQEIVHFAKNPTSNAIKTSITNAMNTYYGTY